MDATDDETIDEFLKQMLDNELEDAKTNNKNSILIVVLWHRLFKYPIRVGSLGSTTASPSCTTISGTKRQSAIARTPARRITRTKS